MDIYVYEPGYRGQKTPKKRTSYGCFIEVKPEQVDGRPTYIMPNEMSGSDYSGGGLYARSNHRSFLKMYGNLDGVHDLYGGYDTFAVAIRSDVAENNTEVKETLAGLENYCVIDDEDHSALQNDAENEAWDDWARREFIHRLLKEDRLADYDEDSLARVIRRKVLKTTAKKCKDTYAVLFYQYAEVIGECWEEESNSMHIDVERVALATIDTLLIHLVPRKELPLLIGRKWFTKDAEQAFEAAMRDTPA